RFLDWDGNELGCLPEMNLEPLRALGWRPPERFSAIATDGKMEIYGTIYFPPDFDPSCSYPIIDHLYPGPQVNRSQPFFDADEIEPMAALGLIGVTIDGRGTPGRSRIFHEHVYRNLGGASGIEDHVAAIHQLAETRPWMDTSRVAVVGHSAGGFATTRAMELFPDFYSVGVSQCGRHDGRLVFAMVLEAYDDPEDPESWLRASAIEEAGKITGKLLLIHGETDRDITLHNTMRLIDKLIEANRDFDLLVVPGDDHVFSRRRHYVERRTWDHLVRHLLDLEPPAGFEIHEHAD
ncbi:MAG: prolyl oligopeptidase family serine peptidase, partial [Thermomicrobiales bacterium]|nr:prolyl oligopeptidase family serine peptidase [Thermomicrobiales bacterium]